MKFTIESQKGITRVKLNDMEISGIKSIEFRHDADKDNLPIVTMSFFPFDSDGKAVIHQKYRTQTERT